jgi:hypothetical protein
MNGYYDNETREFVEEEHLSADDALWLTDDEHNLYILPRLDVTAENEGPDGPIMDELNRIMRDDYRMPTEEEYEALGLHYISPMLRRFNEVDGYYHA